jgi:hypothetical protein
MKHFENTLSDYYPNNAQKEQLIEYVQKGLQKAIYAPSLCYKYVQSLTHMRWTWGSGTSGISYVPGPFILF